jgi:hypothetical protein
LLKEQIKTPTRKNRQKERRKERSASQSPASFSRVWYRGREGRSKIM